MNNKGIQSADLESNYNWDSNDGSPISQSVLLKEINNGSKNAFKYLYTAYYNELCIFANSYTKDADTAEDLVQNVMVSLWEKKKNISITTSIKSYLYRCVYNQFINHYRKVKKEFSLQEELRANILIDFADEDESLTNKKIDLINTEIEKLPTKCKEVFIMSKRQGMKYKEIAEELNITLKTVEAHMCKALKKIILQLKKNQD